MTDRIRNWSNDDLRRTAADDDLATALAEEIMRLRTHASELLTSGNRARVKYDASRRVEQHLRGLEQDRADRMRFLAAGWKRLATRARPPRGAVDGARAVQNSCCSCPPNRDERCGRCNIVDNVIDWVALQPIGPRNNRRPW